MLLCLLWRDVKKKTTMIVLPSLVYLCNLSDGSVSVFRILPSRYSTLKINDLEQQRDIVSSVYYQKHLDLRFQKIVLWMTFHLDIARISTNILIIGQKIHCDFQKGKLSFTRRFFNWTFHPKNVKGLRIYIDPHFSRSVLRRISQLRLLSHKSNWLSLKQN